MNTEELLQKYIIQNCFIVDRIDDLYVALASLREMIKDHELELVLDNSGKSPEQKEAFIHKVINELPSIALREALTHLFEERSFDAFHENSLPGFLNDCQRAAESIGVVKMSIALLLKAEDLQEMALDFSKATGTPIAFKLAVQKNLLGGAVIQYGNYIHDCSLRTKIDQVKTKWKKAVVQE